MKTALSGAALLALLLLPPVRHALESGMALHMLAQFPALMLAGLLLGTALPKPWCRRLRSWNTLGVSGLLAVLLVPTVLMIPRVLDLALVDPRVEAAKVLALLLAGAVLRPSWRAAGIVIQGFFLGNLLPMMVIVGVQYQDAPQRLCNAYRLDDQQQLGLALVWLAGLLALAWLVHAGRRVMGR